MSQAVGSLIRSVVPVESIEDDPVVREPERVASDAGAVWGQPGTFAHSAANPPRDGGEEKVRIVAGFPPPTLYFSGVEVHREWAPVQIADARDGSLLFETEAMKSVTFYLGEHEERVEKSRSNGSVTLIDVTIQHVKEFLTINFPSVEAVGGRGQPAPPATPPLPPPDPEADPYDDPELLNPEGNS